MPVKKVRLMITNEDGTEEQVYPITDVNAVHGLKEFLTNGQIKIGVMSVNGQSGDITIPVLDEEDYVELTEMLEAYEKGEIAGVENIKLHRAWAWNSDGTDRFTTVYPNENLCVRTGETSDKYINTDGSIISNVGTSVMNNAIDVTEGETIFFTQIKKIGDNTAANNYIRFAFYKNDELIIRQALRDAEFDVIVPSSANQLKVSYTTINQIKVEKNFRTLYTPSPLDDFANAYPTHEGLYFGFNDPSVDPSNYKPFVRILGQQSEKGIQGDSGR